MFGGEKRVTQASVRTGAIFTDEFGREWYGSVNNSGHNPGYPIYLRPKGWRAPLIPPSKYMKVTDVHARRVRTQVAQWKQEREQAHRDYDARLMAMAVDMYGNGAADAIERKDKNLFYRMGPVPPPVEQIEAYEQGHPWVLGLDPRKPKSMDAIFPEPPKVEKRKFLTWDEEQKEAHAEEEASEFPKRAFAGKWKLSNGDVVGPCTEAEAVEAEAALLVRV